MTSQTIELAALGRPLYPGMLYDCRKDSFIPGVTLWDKKSLREDLDSRPQLMTDLKFSSSDSLSSKSNLLNVSASLKASFLGGLVEVGGSAKFLNDTKSSNQQSRVTMHYSETSRFDQLTMTQLGKIIYAQVFDQKTATHVVTAVLYGAHAFMVFERSFAENENKQDIEGELNVMVKKIPGFCIEGKGALKMTEEDNKKAETITCIFHGDVHLEQTPTTYLEAVEVYKNLPNLLKKNPQNAVPIKVWLYPLCLLDTKAARLEREISTRLISNTEDMMEGLREVERKCNDLSRRTEVNVFSSVKKRLCSFQDSFSTYRMMLQKALARYLPAIREGSVPEQSLVDILMIHSSSPFNADLLNQWLSDAKSEFYLLNNPSKTLKEINTEDSDRLNGILLDPDIKAVVCLTFTSLKYKDPYLSTLAEFVNSEKFTKLDEKINQPSVTSDVRKWFQDPDVIAKMRENLSVFKKFSEANKNEKNIKFVISAISNPSIPGSSIYLYENGKVADTKFQPVSKPPTPIVKNVLAQTVLLKLQKSSTGETMKYRVEYQQVKAGSDAEEQWLFIDTADEDFSLTELVPGKQYLIRYRIVGKVGVSEASDTVSPTLSSIDNWTRNDFLKYAFSLTLDPNTANNKLVLSEGNKKVTRGNERKPYPDHRDRFDYWEQVLSRESVSGRCYWELEWSGEADIALSYKNISKKGDRTDCLLGRNDKSWSFICTPGEYYFRHNNVQNVLPVKPTKSKIGVYVDYKAGTLSFYGVSDTMSLIHSVQATFTQPLYAGFWIGNGSSVKLCG
ncbi:neoverrucotoxin subunit beta-like [Puntigrus tetrazona]|uniref:neoverrucotoxin subunit beta-like n=1 Tax=Puntigrus tetrazona TaxID=1606681 RepID=UPI001C8A69AC|nr:neoverrucotoxin subunit beta-like [Puntigrus tetrazona]